MLTIGSLDESNIFFFLIEIRIQHREIKLTELTIVIDCEFEVASIIMAERAPSRTPKIGQLNVSGKFFSETVRQDAPYDRDDPPCILCTVSVS